MTAHEVLHSAKFYDPVKKKNIEKVVVEKIMKCDTKFKLKPIWVKKSKEKIEANTLPDTKEAELWVWSHFSPCIHSFLVWYDTNIKKCLLCPKVHVISIITHSLLIPAVSWCNDKEVIYSWKPHDFTAQVQYLVYQHNCFVTLSK